jgi:hypothetical protein
MGPITADTELEARIRAGYERRGLEVTIELRGGAAWVTWYEEDGDPQLDVRDLTEWGRP